MNQAQPDLLPLLDAIERATGQRISPPTATRWAIQGCQGTVLQTKLLGKKRLCKIEWVMQFVEARSQSPKTKTAKSKSRTEIEALLGRRG